MRFEVREASSVTPSALRWGVDPGGPARLSCPLRAGRGVLPRQTLGACCQGSVQLCPGEGLRPGAGQHPHGQRGSREPEPEAMACACVGMKFCTLSQGCLAGVTVSCHLALSLCSLASKSRPRGRQQVHSLSAEPRAMSLFHAWSLEGEKSLMAPEHFQPRSINLCFNLPEQK